MTDRTADDHARLIRRAIADAEADGFVVDFNWGLHWGVPDGMHLAVVHADVNWKKAVRIWPTAS